MAIPTWNIYNTTPTPQYLGRAQPQSPPQFTPCRVSESQQNSSSSPRDAWDHAYSLFTMMPSNSQSGPPLWISPSPRELSGVVWFIKPGLLILNSVQFDWLHLQRSLTLGSRMFSSGLLFWKDLNSSPPTTTGHMDEFYISPLQSGKPISLYFSYSVLYQVF